MPKRKAPKHQAPAVEPVVEVRLDAVSVVHVRTGEVERPAEFLAHLRALEQHIQTTDDEIVVVAQHLKELRTIREENVAALRSAVRNVTAQPLPLFDDAGASTNE